jgi:hypothetical protein
MSLKSSTLESSLIAEKISAAVVKPKSINKRSGTESADGIVILSGFTSGNMCHMTYSTNKASNYPVNELLTGKFC